MPTLAAGAASHTGLVREHNEDSALNTQSLFAVADGMGGHAAGEVASRLAIARMMQLVENPELGSPDIVEAIAAANADIRDSGARDAGRLGMGTTLTGLALVGPADAPSWVVFNVGDSRVYRFADDELTQLTVDHSEVEELVAAGQLSAEEAKRYPRRNVVTRSLGSSPPPKPDVWPLPLIVGERFVICSDGLNLEVDNDELAAILRAEPDSQRAADRLVAAAVAAGGRDNVTVIVVTVEP